MRYQNEKNTKYLKNKQKEGQTMSGNQNGNEYNAGRMDYAHDRLLKRQDDLEKEFSDFRLDTVKILATLNTKISTGVYIITLLAGVIVTKVIGYVF